MLKEKSKFNLSRKICGFKPTAADDLIPDFSTANTGSTPPGLSIMVKDEREKYARVGFISIAINLYALFIKLNSKFYDYLLQTFQLLAQECDAVVRRMENSGSKV